ncbi:MAG: hypothetical protein AB2L07_05480 [Thermoanaerobaculaceae bacterium]
MSLTATVRTEVAVGTASEASMFSARRRAGPTSGTASGGTGGGAAAAAEGATGVGAGGGAGAVWPGAGR